MTALLYHKTTRFILPNLLDRPHGLQPEVARLIQ